jgi:prepilin-type N-terminal cleavage/methylation domain-containing protein
MKITTASPARGGFTLIEVVVATILVGLTLTALMVSVRSNIRVNDAGTKLTQADFLAQEIREWTLTLPFRDQDVGDRDNQPGSDGTSPQTWVDDLDDLMNVTYCPPRDGQGYAITALGAWSQTITMTWRDPNDLSQTVTNGTSDIIYVNVDVKYENKLILGSKWLVTKKPGEY